MCIWKTLKYKKTNRQMALILLLSYWLKSETRMFFLEIFFLFLWESFILGLVPLLSTHLDLPHDIICTFRQAPGEVAIDVQLGESANTEQSHPSTDCSLLPPRSVLVHEWGSHSCAQNLSPLLLLLLTLELSSTDLNMETWCILSLSVLSLLTEWPKLFKC